MNFILQTATTTTIIIIICIYRIISRTIINIIKTGNRRYRNLRDSRLILFDIIVTVDIIIIIIVVVVIIILISRGTAILIYKHQVL